MVEYGLDDLHDQDDLDQSYREALSAAHALDSVAASDGRDNQPML